MALKPVAQIELPGLASTTLAGARSSAEPAALRDLARRRATSGGRSSSTTTSATSSATTSATATATVSASPTAAGTDPSAGTGGLAGTLRPPALSPVAQFTGSLFDPNPQDLARRLARAFERWCETKSTHLPGQRSVKSEATREVYAGLWGGFADWCCAQLLDLPDLTRDDLAAFFAHRSKLAGQELSNRYKLHLLRLIASVIEHEAQIQQIEPNLAPLEMIESDLNVRHADARNRVVPITALDDTQARTLIAFTLSPHALKGIGVPGPMPEWQGVRARACVALQLGAGLAPVEVRALRTDHVVLRQCPKGRGLRPWKVFVPQLGDAEAREVPLMPWAASVLHRWLQVRREQGLVGDVLLPTDKSGLPMSRSLHYMSIKAVFEGAQLKGATKRGGAGKGKDTEKGKDTNQDEEEASFGGYVLRHTFALICLHAQYTPEQVAVWLGLKDLDKMRRYRTIVFMPHGSIFGIGLADDELVENLECAPS
jgi:integrase